MKPTQIRLFLMCLLATGCATQSQALILDEGGTRATGADLWTRAVNIAGKNARWEAGKYTIRFEVRDGSGNVEQTQTMTYERKLSPQGSLIEKLVSATKNGEDVTAARRQEEESQQQAESTLQNSAAKEKNGTIQVRLYDKHPFDSDDQEAVTIERRDETRQIQNRTCQGYKFRFEQGDGAFTSGMAWLDVKTGAAIEMRFTQRPLPPHAEDLISTIRFEYTPDGTWRVKEKKSESQAKFLFWTKTLTDIQDYDDYWLRED